MINFLKILGKVPVNKRILPIKLANLSHIGNVQIKNLNTKKVWSERVLNG